MVALFAWSLNTILSGTLGDDAPPADRDDAGVLANDQPGGGEPGDVQALLKECAAAVSEIEQAVAAAEPGITHWSTHVKARTDMLKGRITQKRMEAIYDRTRSHGHADHARLEKLQPSLEEPQPCADLRATEAQPAMPETRDCLARSDAAAQASMAARNALREWSSHLQHMDRYEDGGMSTGVALRLWIRAWRTAPANISAYHDAATALDEAPSCAAP